jgi:hypothetical protein
MEPTIQAIVLDSGSAVVFADHRNTLLDSATLDIYVQGTETYRLHDLTVGGQVSLEGADGTHFGRYTVESITTLPRDACRSILDDFATRQDRYETLVAAIAQEVAPQVWDAYREDRLAMSRKVDPRLIKEYLATRVTEAIRADARITIAGQPPSLATLIMAYHPAAGD